MSRPCLPALTRPECVLAAMTLAWTGFVLCHSPEMLAATGAGERAATLWALLAVVLGAFAGSQAWIELRAALDRTP